MTVHRWLVPHLIDLITYSEKHALTEVAVALHKAIEKIAPRLAAMQVDQDIPAPQPALPSNIHILGQAVAPGSRPFNRVVVQDKADCAVVISPSVWAARRAASARSMSPTPLQSGQAMPPGSSDPQVQPPISA